jgi:hypothetical protein
LAWLGSTRTIFMTWLDLTRRKKNPTWLRLGSIFKFLTRLDRRLGSINFMRLGLPADLARSKAAIESNPWFFSNYLPRKISRWAVKISKILQFVRVFEKLSEILRNLLFKVCREKIFDSSVCHKPKQVLNDGHFKMLKSGCPDIFGNWRGVSIFISKYLQTTARNLAIFFSLEFPSLVVISQHRNMISTNCILEISAIFNRN